MSLTAVTSKSLRASYLSAMSALPTIIDAPGRYVTRCGEVVEVTQAPVKHHWADGQYSRPRNIQERWHTSGRLYSFRTSDNDIVSKAPDLPPRA